MVFFIFVIGVCLGSFFLVIGKRLPKNENVINTRSRCDHCQHQLGILDLIPIFSYIFLRGKCRYCKKKISPLNLIVELITGSLFSLGYLYYGFCYEFWIFLIITSISIIIYISDFSYFIILDSPLVIGGIIIFFLKWYYFGIYETLLSVASGIGLFLAMYGIKLLGDFMFKRESLGGGDIKFSFIIGLVLSFRLGLCSLILSTFLALPYCFAAIMLKKNNEVPYGPFLAASLFLVFIFQLKFINLLDYLFISI